MKRKTLSVILSLFLSVASMAQVVPYVVYPKDINHTLTVQNPYDFNYAQYGTSSNQLGYKFLCNSQTSAQFRVDFTNPSYNNDVKYYLDIYRVYFNPLYGTPSYSISVGGTKVYTSSEITVKSWSNITYNLTLNAEPNAYYYAVVHHKFKIIGTDLYQTNWENVNTNNVNFLPGSNSQAAGNINTVSSITKPSYYGPLAVGEFNLAQSVILDGAASSCESNYGITIDELNLATWTVVPGGTIGTGWLSGQVGSINLKLLYPNGFAYGKTYQVSLYVGPVWDIKYFYITPKPAAVNGSVNYSSSRQVAIPGLGSYTVFRVTDCDAVMLNTAGTNYATKYKIDVDKVSSSTLDVVPGTNSSTGWLSGSIPPSYNISALSGYTLGGGIYRISYSVGEPVVTKYLFIEFSACPRSTFVENNGFTSMEENESAADISIYPNPSNGLFNLKFNSAADGQVSIYDIVGKKVEQIRLLQGISDYSFDLSNYTKGIYVVEVAVNGNKYIRKVILQ